MLSRIFLFVCAVSLASACSKKSETSSLDAFEMSPDDIKNEYWAYAYPSVFLKFCANGLKATPGIAKTIDVMLRPFAGEINECGKADDYYSQQTTISLASKPIVDLTPVASYVKMEKLDVSYGTEPIDFTVLYSLADYETLKNIQSQERNLVDVSSLARISSLEVLNLFGNKIQDLGPLAQLKNLRELRLNKNNIVDLTPLADMKSLQLLALSGNQIEDLRPLANLNLKVLSVGTNPIKKEFCPTDSPNIELNEFCSTL